MTEKLIEIELERTKRGRAALWEEGGGYTRTGWAQIVAGPAGERLSPLYIRTTGHLACGRHALFAVGPGFHVVQACRQEGWRILRIESVEHKDGKLIARCTVVAEHELGETVGELYGALEEAVIAARRKARCYHCREPHYYKA